MDFQFIFDTRSKQHFVELGSEHKVIEKYFTEEVCPEGANVTLLTNFKHALLTDSPQLLGSEWSIEKDQNELTLYHNSYASELSKFLQSNASSLQAENGTSFTSFDELDDHLSHGDEELNLALSSDDEQVKTDDHMLSCGKDDLLYLIDKWIVFIEG